MRKQNGRKGRDFKLLEKNCMDYFTKERFGKGFSSLVKKPCAHCRLPSGSGFNVFLSAHYHTTEYSPEIRNAGIIRLAKDGGGDVLHRAKATL